MLPQTARKRSRAASRINNVVLKAHPKLPIIIPHYFVDLLKMVGKPLSVIYQHAFLQKHTVAVVSKLDLTHRKKRRKHRVV